jgi:hypothetical protein
MKAINKKHRLRLVLVAAAALGSSSATLSGTLAAFASQAPAPIAGA